MNIWILKNFLNKIKNNQINFDDAFKKQNDVKLGRKTLEQKEVITNIENFYKSREETFNFFKDYAKMMLDSNYKAKQNKTKGTELKILSPKQMLQTLLIALAQVQGGNNSENLLNEIRRIVYSLYRSKEITKKVYNKIIKSIK